MPRRNRAARERATNPQPDAEVKSAAPVWATVPGADVRAVTGEKAYRCPGCDHEIRGGTPHLVVVPGDTASERRHWHTNCWRQELRRTRAR